MATWRELISSALTDSNESWDDVVYCTLSDAQLDREFNDDWGGIEGDAFTMWTSNHVYFPVCYDGAEWVGSVPRNPQQTPIGHIGGG